jgi:hypothetical protein
MTQAEGREMPRKNCSPRLGSSVEGVERVGSAWEGVVGEEVSVKSMMAGFRGENGVVGLQESEDLRDRWHFRWNNASLDEWGLQLPGDKAEKFPQ